MRRLPTSAATVVLLIALGALAFFALPSAETAARDLAVQAAPQSTTGYTWIALPLSVFPDGSTAANLASHVEANNNGTVTVETISRWNAVAQSYDIYYHQYNFGDFPISNQSAYRAETTGSSGAVWTQVGDVPAIGSYNYTLLETASTDYNWIMYPLDRPSTNMASDLSTDVETNASAAVTVQTISRWNAVAQSWDIYYHQYSFGDFDVTPGYPYRVEIDVTTGDSVTWP